MKRKKPEPFNPAMPPAGLSDDSRAWWAWILEEFALDVAQTPILAAALQARDRAAEARECIEQEGALVRDRWEQLKPNPAVSIERDALGLLVRSWKALNLDVQPPGPNGRPPLPMG